MPIRAAKGSSRHGAPEGDGTRNRSDPGRQQGEPDRQRNELDALCTADDAHIPGDKADSEYAGEQCAEDQHHIDQPHRGERAELGDRVLCEGDDRSHR
ncbi:hypothetical protein [Nonomuraea bangladeshensis]|uniref:hypothetical protein n=1 Tax=Nonomuraea bangladeshensis TaxID=404385 RepID=UPI0031E06237